MKDTKKIFLVEDDPSMMSLLRTLLEMDGFQVNNPSLKRLNFISSVGKYQPDLILMDVNLGKISGLDVLKKIKSLDQLREIKVIMTSGTNLEEECINMGADCFILKPYIPDELIEKVKELTCD